MHPYLWRVKGTIMRLTCPLFFQKIGRGSQFTGRIRLPMPFRNIVLGNNAMIGHDVFFQTGRSSRIEIGDDVSLNSGCHVVASELISIGNNVAVGEYVTIRDQDHNFTPATGVRDQGFKVAPVIIEDNVWIGRGVHIGPGSHIRSGSIVAANAVVRGSYPANVLIAGVPARVRRRIDENGRTVPLTDNERTVSKPPAYIGDPS